MTIEEMKNRLEKHCNSMPEDCDGCVLNVDNGCYTLIPDEQVIANYNLVFGGDKKEEINHPDRYASGKFECIDVMIDVFGTDAVKHFCILNVFKYLWRAEKKNGVEDIKKAVWYLNKYIELEGGEKQ